MRLTVGLTTLALWLSTASAFAAPIRLTAELDTGQSGPVYAWSLRLLVQPGYEVSAFSLFTTGWTNVQTDYDVLNFSDTGDGEYFFSLGAGSLDSSFPGAGTDTFLGTLLGPFGGPGSVSLGNPDEAAFFIPGGAQYLPTLVELRIVPEPVGAAWLALASALLLLGRARSFGP